MVIEMNRVHLFVVYVSLFLVLLCLGKKVVAMIYCICVMPSLECYKLSLLGAKRPYLHEVVHRVIIILIRVIDCVLSLSVKAF